MREKLTIDTSEVVEFRDVVLGLLDEVVVGSED